LFIPHPAEQRMAEFVGVYRPAAAARTGGLRAGTPEFLQALDRRLQRSRQSSSTSMLLVRGNVGMTYGEFTLIRLLVALAAVGLTTLRLYGSIGVLGVLVGALVGFGASLIPLAVLRIVAGRRVGAFEAQLPDALDLLQSSLQAGGGLAQGIGLVAREMQPPISEELQRVVREVEIGLSYNEALSNMVDRLGSEDLDLIVTVINVQSRVGGNLVQIFKVINATIRDRMRIRGQIQVLTAQQRLSSYVISAIPPGLGFILWTMNHAYIERLFQPGIGEVMLIISVLMAIAGFLVLRKIADIEV
jgi:tight adherence protein B